MPSPQALALAEADREAQAAQAALVAILVARLFRDLDVVDIQASGRRFLDLLIPFLRLRRAESATATLATLARIRAAETGVPAIFRLIDGAAPAPESLVEGIQQILVARDLVELNEEQVRTSLAITGPVELRRRLLAGQPEPEARRAASVAVAGAAVKHVLNGGREATIAASRADSRAVGYYRATKPGCCSFCAMLASRGPVYDDDSFDLSDPRFQGDGKVKVHDTCACSLVVAYSKVLTPQAQQLSEDWAESQDGLTTTDLNAFRRFYEAKYPRTAA